MDQDCVWQEHPDKDCYLQLNTLTMTPKQIVYKIINTAEICNFNAVLII